ncbi:MAG TPA: NAD(P)/FAD-dependent oxidoreductase [Candidatus Faecousia intestinigallinarum]|nr:NAD(P)/FAD-dependent oxidoreductase [Candidatus Faecousia intestinigallinarum]
MRYDGIVIGGGPAGMFAAITAAEQGQRVLLLERNDRLGKKLLITGKGRCNVANHCSAQEVLENVPRNGRFLYSALTAFPPQRVMDFFEKHGCPLKVERGNRVFPVSDRAASVLEALKSSLRQTGVEIRCDRARKILTAQGAVAGVQTNGAAIDASWVILATGGLPYPTTGSTGDGYAMAEAMGHTIVPPHGSLVPLEIAGQDCPEMQGLSLRNVGVKLLDEKGKSLFSDFGELLFTHFGVSGPTVLSASAHLKGEGCRLVIDLKPALDAEKLNERILRDMEQYKNRTMEHAMVDLLPRSMIPVVLRRLRIDPAAQANSLKKQQRRAMVELLKGFPLEITGRRPVAEAIITSGGVKVTEIDPKTMASKKVEGLFFAGEIIDCDAYTGGFNLQIAWSTGFAAGIGAASQKR